MTDLACAEARIGYVFSDKSLLKLALTHTSYANEHSANGHGDSNQRLEFLGDSVLGTVISTAIYEKFPRMPEGELSRFRAGLVCEASLAAVASRLELGEAMRFGHGEQLSSGAKKPSVLADCLEALIAAVYLDSGFSRVSRFVLDDLGFSAMISAGSAHAGPEDSKTRLQEYYNSQEYRIAYEIVGRSGPDHNTQFEAEVNVFRDSTVIRTGRGTGASKKAAEQAAANYVLSLIDAGSTNG